MRNFYLDFNIVKLYPMGVRSSIKWDVSVDREDQQNLHELSKSLNDLDQRVRTLEGLLRIGPGFIEKTLKSRGLEYAGFVPTDQIMQPVPPTAVNLEQFYNQLHRYSFRLFLRDVVAHRKRFNLDHLTRYCSQRVAKKYLNLLVDLGLADPLKDNSFRLTNLNVHTFGETLEWYVAQVFRREFGSPALWGLEVRDLSHGGDFDVLAEVDRRLVYVEVKSSPPKGIHLPNVEAFLIRVKTLSPDVALFLVDTHLRMEDKIIVLFQQAKERFPDEVESIQRMTRGMFRVGRRVFTFNTKPNLINNIRVCLKSYFRSNN